VTKVCPGCSRSYVAKSPKSVTCSDRCRKRMSRGTPVRDRPVPISGDVTPVESGIVTATRAELEAAGRLDTAIGQAALALAEIMGTQGETASGRTAAAREWRATMAEALRAAVPLVADPVDELARRREEKLAAG